MKREMRWALARLVAFIMFMAGVGIILLCFITSSSPTEVIVKMLLFTLFINFLPALLEHFFGED